ncbi:KASH domain-containing protein [Caerostris darwini]|uniref:KASH domain-containing protein n=1 Tax=Caerostris darwini TaxID=1538125 RepID=A0AAV4VIJ6_9ARAC|nr:KASH domain-containing protein [Caerostris darwini]
MRLVIAAILKCWILCKNHREASDFELDEGPLNKHRRLTLDRWTAVNSTANMEKMRMERNKTTNVIKTGLLTKDIGVLCSDLIPVNDKCIMVGTTGIAALKAEYGDDFTNFEIIQDVGYSSESSTHLSSDDGISVGGDRYFNIRVYNYADEKTPPKTINLKEELDKADSSKQSSSLASSVGSSSGAPSFDDSGLGAADLLVTRETTSPEIDKTLLTDDCDPYDLCLPGEESDFLETVLDNCVDFCTSDSEKDGNGIDDLQYNLSGIESDDSADNFHNKKSFTTSSQLFYKMILVDSENEEEIQDSEYNKVKNETLPNSELMVGSELSPDTTPEFASDINENVVTLKNKPFKEIGSSSTDSEQETYKAHEPINPDEGFKRNSFQKSKYLSSTPIQKQDTRSMGILFPQI